MSSAGVLTTGLSGLMDSQATREVNLSCGLTLIFSKFRFSDYADRESEILRRRGPIKEKVQEIVNLFADLKGKEDAKYIREQLLLGLKEATKELTIRPAHACVDEEFDFANSSVGKAYDLYLATRRKTPEIVCFEDAWFLQESFMTESDLSEIRVALDWSAELEYLKNSGSPSQLQNPEDGDQQIEKQLSSVGG